MCLINLVPSRRKYFYKVVTKTKDGKYFSPFAGTEIYTYRITYARRATNDALNYWNNPMITGFRNYKEAVAFSKEKNNTISDRPNLKIIKLKALSKVYDGIFSGTWNDIICHRDYLACCSKKVEFVKEM